MTPVKETSAGTLRGKHLLYFMLAQLVLQTILQLPPINKTPDNNEKLTHLSNQVDQIEKKLDRLNSYNERLTELEMNVEINSQNCSRRNSSLKNEIAELKENYIFPIYKNSKP